MLLALACAPRVPEAREAPAERPASESTRPTARECAEIVAIEVWKAARILKAQCKGGTTLEFPVALGSGIGPKRRSGDRRTPEGDYRVAAPARPSRFHLFIPINYPSPRDAERAWEEQELSDEEYEQILAAHAHGVFPPQDTALGGDLGLHGEGNERRGLSARSDWTWGCIAMSDERIEFLAERVSPGVTVRIRP